MSSRDREQLLWRFMDGSCTEQERTDVQHKIATDTDWRSHYERLLAFEAEIGKAVSVDEPSMRFSKNVMEAIADTQPARPARSLLPEWLPKMVFIGMMAMVVAIIILSVPVLRNTDWGTASDSPLHNITSRIDISTLLKTHGLTLGIFTANVVLLLVLADHIRGSKRRKAMYP